MKNFYIRSPKKFYALTALIETAIVAALIYYFAREIHIYPLCLISTSIVTFVMYGFDKMQAKRNGDRVPEIVLHLLAVAGGFIGGWAGRFAFRHKTLEPFFMIVLTAAALLHVGLCYYLYVH